MKKIYLVIVVCSVGLNAYGFGDQGHNAIWAVARSLLDENVRAKVDQLSDPTEVPKTAVWLDKARSAYKKHQGPLADDEEAMDFSTRFPHHDLWHFVNLPLGAASYDEDTRFQPKDDVVHAIDLCIRTLEGKHTGLSKRLALICLVHLVGDIHQPLHCGTGYFDVSAPEHPVLIRDAETAFSHQHTEDRGGNQLFYGPGSFDELHAYWDGELVKAAAGDTGSVATLTSVLKSELPNVNASSTGDLHEWAKQWATESVHLADAGYKNISFGQCTLSNQGTISRIEIRLPDGYKETQTEVVKEQLAKAAQRLADLLNAVMQ